MPTYIELFAYFKTEREHLFDALEKWPFDEVSKNRELSFYSIKDVLLHTIDVEDNWLHYVPKKLLLNRPNWEDFKDIASIRRRASEVDEKTRNLFKEIRPIDLATVTTRQYPDGTSSTQTMEQILNHVPLEVIHHYGEIFAEFWKINEKAPYYSFLKFQTEAKRAGVP